MVYCLCMENFFLGIVASLQGAQIQFQAILQHQLLFGIIVGFLFASFFYSIFVLNFPKNFMSVMFSKDAARCYHNICEPKSIGSYNRLSFSTFQKHLEHLQLTFFLSFFVFIFFISIIYLLF